MTGEIKRVVTNLHSSGFSNSYLLPCERSGKTVLFHFTEKLRSACLLGGEQGRFHNGQSSTVVFSDPARECVLWRVSVCPIRKLCVIPEKPGVFLYSSEVK
jgi:hypothetical protein